MTPSIKTSLRWTAVACVLAFLIYPIYVHESAHWNDAPPAARTASLAPKPAHPLLNDSPAKYKSGNWQATVDASIKAIRSNPTSAPAYNNLAVGELGLKNYDAAEIAARVAIRLDPRMQLARNNLAWIRAEKAKAAR